MASINVSGLSLQFPIFGADAHSLKKTLAARTIGGAIGRNASGSAVVQALHGITFNLKAGDRLGLVGPNGSGKTTLLRTLAGAYAPDSGRVETDGRITALLDIGIGMDPFANGYENIYMRGMLSGFTRKEIHERIDEIVAFSGLGEFVAMPLKAYSAGMQARLAFAAATAFDSDILLMDEWIAAGDADFRQSAHKRLVDMVDKAKVLVLASHDENIINTFCNKVLHLKGGRVVDFKAIG
jgi:lipopolysaccharide transport system ATP-binding protein